MIDFRYHVVSIVAVFLALAIGIVLGSTELQGTTFNILNHTTAKLQNEYDQARSQLATAQSQANQGEQYAAAVEPAVLRDLLPGQRLLIVTEPGAQPQVVSGISAAATDAGASVTGQIALQPKFFDTSDATRDSLNQTTLDVAQAANIALTPADNFQQQAAQVIGSEILVKSTGSASASQPSASPASASPASASPASASPASTSPASTSPASTSPASTSQAANAQTMLSAYASSGFLNTTGQPATPATLVVIVTPQNVPADGAADPFDRVLVPLAAELAAKSSATVVAGSSAGSGPGSPIAVLRSTDVSNQVSTVDDADLVSGQTVTIQALAAMLNGGKAGSYGFTDNGASAVAPTPAPTPSASPSPTASATVSANKKAKK